MAVFTVCFGVGVNEHSLVLCSGPLWNTSKSLMCTSKTITPGTNTKYSTEDHCTMCVRSLVPIAKD